MHHVASIISTRKLGYYVDIVSDGTLFVGAFYVHGGLADFIPGTGSRSLLETLAFVERHLLTPPGRTLPKTERSYEEHMELRWDMQANGECDE